MKPIGTVALVLWLASSSIAIADECGDAVRDYNEVISKLTDAMEQFRTCIADSKGMDGCAKQFSQLRSIYNQYSSVVAFYSKQCEMPMR
jgi:hypothetical protein